MSNVECLEEDPNQSCLNDLQQKSAILFKELIAVC